MAKREWTRPGRRGDGGRRREIVTPEGVPIHVVLAHRGDRMMAFMIDLLIIIGIVIVAVLLALLAVAGEASWTWVLSFVLVLMFFLRAFYFIFFELRSRGRTPGKRLLGLRVVDRRGGRLQAGAIFARNLMREVEFFIPITLLMAPVEGGLDGWVTLTTLGWVMIFLLMPLFNRDSLRVGDLVAGTWVIAVPKAELLPDITSASAAAPSAGAAATAPATVFTLKELDAYGIYELQTLEDLLRLTGSEARPAQRVVAERIHRRIGRPPPDPNADPKPFLEAYYAALRSHLEHKMLLGVRREDKFDTVTPPKSGR
jgi:uncharacterized RDD family membrane protein YckC